MDVLLIGAGAVGQVYGYHFQRSGARVAFYVREKYAAAAREGFTLYDFNRGASRARPIRFEGFDVLTTMEEVRERTWDLVVLCLPSTALTQGSWLEELGASLGDATLVNLTPDAEDHAVIARHVKEAQIVGGLIGLLSYHGPLPGDELPEEGMVFWVPPLTRMTFSGAGDRPRVVARALSKGGLSSKVVPSTTHEAAFADPVLQLFVAALEIADWRFETLSADRGLMTLAHRATREAFDAVATRLGVKVPLAMRLFRPWMLRLSMRLSRFVVPFDLERFFAVHFTKVGAQTELIMRNWLTLTASLKAPSGALQEIFDRLLAKRAVTSVASIDRPTSPPRA